MRVALAKKPTSKRVKSTDENMELVQAANVSRLVKANMADMLIQLEGRIVTDLVNKNKTGNLTPQHCFTAVGGLTMIRDLISIMDKSINSGVKAMEREMEKLNAEEEAEANEEN